jgi:hypothetical protein
MNKNSKIIHWKALISGILATLIISTLLITSATLIADIIIFKIDNKPYSFSLFPKSDGGFLSFSLGLGGDPRHEMKYLHFYDKWFPIISLVLAFLGFGIGGYITARIAKMQNVLNSIITGTVAGLLFLSWLFPVGIAAAYIGAVVVRSKPNDKFKT